MDPAKILVVFGTRPEIVKMAPVISALEASEGLTPVVCLTAQHREMVDQMAPVFGINPDYDLGLMVHDQAQADVAGRVLQRLTAIIHEVAPEYGLVQGDTTTAMAAAIAFHYAGIPVGHVEAGLRTGDLYQPFPEEANRRIISAVSSLYFAPTERARAALLAESVPDSRIFVTGNTVVDAIRQILAGITSPPAPSERQILVTCHRRENFGAPLASLCRAIKALLDRHEDLSILFPVHPNPNVEGPVYEILGNEPRVQLVAPLGYPEFVKAMAASYLVLTDSGGVQEEAPVLGKPVLVLRNKSERLEAVDAGCVLLVGTEKERIVREVDNLLEDQSAYAHMSQATSPFGDGHAAERICALLEEEVNRNRSGITDRQGSPLPSATGI